MIDRSKHKSAKERAPQIAAMASQGMTSREIATAIGEISARRVQVIAKKFCITLTRPADKARHFGFYASPVRAQIITELARTADVSPATMIDRITRVVLDDGIDHARKRLGKFAIAATTYSKQGKP